MFAFFNDLHINLNVAIEKRENFDAIIERDAIFVQNIDFRDVAIDKNSEEISKENVFSERSRTISCVNIEKDKSFDDEKDEKMIDSKANKTDETKNEITCSTNC